jgi:hypothetical protein
MVFPVLGAAVAVVASLTGLKKFPLAGAAGMARVAGVAGGFAGGLRKKPVMAFCCGDRSRHPRPPRPPPPRG